MSSIPAMPGCGAEPAGNADSIPITIELGKTTVNPSEAQRLRPGALIALEEFSNDPVAIFAGSKFVGRGEILLMDGQMGVRITELYRCSQVLQDGYCSPSIFQ